MNGTVQDTLRNLMIAKRNFIAILLLMVHCSTCQNSCGLWGNHLLLAKEGSIIKANLDGKNQNSILKTSTISESIKDFEYSHAHKSLFWGDFNSRQIWKLRDGESKPEPAVPSQGRWWPCHLKVDDFGEKMYVVDCWSNSVNIFDVKTGERAVVLANNFTDIKAFKVDWEAGYLFVVDQYRIFKAHLNGSNLMVLYEELKEYNEKLSSRFSKSFPEPVLKFLHYLENSRFSDLKSFSEHQPITIDDIALDFKSKRVFSVDSAKRKIESFDYDGKDRRVLFYDGTRKDSSDEPVSTLSFLDGWLYWLDKTDEKLFKINISTKNPSKTFTKNDNSKVVLAIGCTKNRKTGGSACSKDNGQCQQLCVFSKSKEKNYACACKIGYELNTDGKSCSPVKEFILYTQSGSLRGRSMNMTLQTFTDVLNPSAFSVGKGTGIQFNAADELVYYSSLYPDNQIHQVSLKTGEVKLLQPDLLSSKVGLNMAFDWQSRNLYYFTYYYNDVTTLSVINVDDPTYSKILVRNVPRLVRAVAVHPHLGYVYLAQGSDDDWTTISRMAMDGSGLTVLIRQKGSINDLAIDYQENRLYWCESQNIWFSNLDGRFVNKFKLPLEGVTSLTIYKNHIYMISKYDQVLSRTDKNELTSVEIISNTEELNSFSGIEIFSRRSQKKRPGHPCSRHKCEKYCFPVPDSQGNLRATCGCPYGEKLARDGQTCEDNRDQEPSFVPCQSSSFLCSMKTEIMK